MFSTISHVEACIEEVTCLDDIKIFNISVSSLIASMILNSKYCQFSQGDRVLACPVLRSNYVNYLILAQNSTNS